MFSTIMGELHRYDDGGDGGDGGGGDSGGGDSGGGDSGGGDSGCGGQSFLLIILPTVMGGHCKSNIMNFDDTDHW